MLSPTLKRFLNHDQWLYSRNFKKDKGDKEFKR